ncbi:MAG TPA: hypothetical protein VMT85_23015 [Thermoanaerobaculia bacterium]|nr:hypothetical protein [Thermoanaerobaculia bacterium]
MTTTSITAGPAGREASEAARSAASTVRLDVEIATLGSEAYAPGELIPLFHELIREQALDDLLIDVADYSHVPEGPGLVLIGHDAVISYRDRLGGPAGQRSHLYSRRRESRRPLEPATPAARLRSALRNTLAAARVLEQRLGERMRWDTRSFEVTLNDRLHAPHADATRLAWRPEVEALAARICADARFRVTDRGGDPRERVGFLVEGSAWVEPLDAILARIAPGEASGDAS